MGTQRLGVSVSIIVALAATASAAPKRFNRVLARSDQVMPDGTTVRFPHEESIVNGGDAAFEVSTNLQESLFTVWIELDGELVAAARTGDTADGATVASMLLTRQPPIARSGRVLFLDDNYTLWKWDGTLHLVAKRGDVIDGGTVDTITTYMMNSYGDIVFRETNKNAWYQHDGQASVRIGGPGVTHPSVPGVPLLSTGLYCGPGISDLGTIMVPLGDVILGGPPGNLVPIYRINGAAPTGGTHEQYLDCQLAMDSGVVTILSDDYQVGFKQRIYRAETAQGPIQQLPALPPMTTLSAANRRMVSAGHFAGMNLPYAAELTEMASIYKILAVGDPAPGAPTETVASVVVEDINSTGQILMTGTTSSGAKAIWFYNLNPAEIEVIAQTGGTFDLGSGGVVVATDVKLFGASGGGGYHMLDDDGNVAFHISYGSNKQASLVSGTALIVNSSYDDPNIPNSKICNTGQQALNGEPECTLRAAIQAANTRGRKQTIRFDLFLGSTIFLDSQLPAVTVPIEIVAEADNPITIQPNAGAGLMGGLSFENNGSTSLHHLVIKNFTGYAVKGEYTFLQLHSCDVFDNASWGVRNFGPVKIDSVDPATHRSVIARNVLGGISAETSNTGPTIELVDVDVFENQGPGAASDGLIQIAATRITMNRGAGIAVLDGGGDEPAVAVTVVAGGDGSLPSIENNFGYGILSNFGLTSLSVRSPIAISNNHSWGIATFGVVEFLDGPEASSVDANGAGTTCYEPGNTLATAADLVDAHCEGGGIVTLSNEPAAVNKLAAVFIEDNNGPGILAAAPLELVAVGVARNHGPGVMLSDSGGVGDHAVPGILIASSMFDGNFGPGVYSQLGFISVLEASDFINNHGPGIASDGGDVDFDTAADRTVVADNGVTGACTIWEITADDIRVTTDACGSGGVDALLADVTGRAVDILNNTGNGITATNVTLHDARLCGNTGEAIVATTKTLETVDLCLIDPPDDEPTGESDGGCLQVSPTGASPILLALLALRRRRRAAGSK